MISGHPGVRPTLLMKCFPGESAVCVAASRHLRRYGFAPDVAVRLGLFLEDLQEAKYQTFELQAVNLADRPDCVDVLFPLTAAWLDTCYSVIDLIDCLDTELRCIHGIGSQGSTPCKIQLLRSAFRGEYSCIGNDGAFQLPPWAEQRKSTRIQMQDSVAVWRGGVCFHASLRDISAFGLGLSDLGGCKPGDGLIVERATKRLQGEVIWVRGTSVGVNLTDCHNIYDPVLEASFKSLTGSCMQEH